MISTLQKSLIILHLCLAFSLFLWLLFDPFLGQHFRLRTDLLLLENIRGDAALVEKASPHEKGALAFNQVHWGQLDPSLRHSLLTSEKRLLATIKASFWQKLSKGLYYFFVKTPFFELAWVFFSIVICILCLKCKEGAKKATLILPLIVVLYAVDQAKKQRIPPSLPFPTEDMLVKNYLKHPLSLDLTTQREEILYGFDLYLIEKWAQETPSTDRAEFLRQRQKGAFEFHLAQAQERLKVDYSPSRPSEHSALLLLYFLWNTGFAFSLSRK